MGLIFRWGKQPPAPSTISAEDWRSLQVRAARANTGRAQTTAQVVAEVRQAVQRRSKSAEN